MKRLLLILMVLGIIILAIIFVLSQRPFVTKTCQTDSDCSSNEVCKQQGPIVLDPVTKKPLTGKTCVKKDSVVPF